MRYSYKRARETLRTILGDLDILSGDTMGPSGVTWQDVAGTCAVNLRHLASLIEEARKGNVSDGPVVFPNAADAMEDLDNGEDES